MLKNFLFPSKKIVILSSVAAATGGVFLLRDTFRGSEFKKDVRCEGKVAVVTDGSVDVGKEIAKELSKRGAIVYILCKNKSNCDRIRKEIIISSKNKYVYSRECDMESLSSIRQFVQQFLKEEYRLDILINNAEIWNEPKGKTKEGFEKYIGVNHFGHFYITNLLLELIKKSAPSRIINISAATYVNGKINKEDLNSEKDFSNSKAYNQSKLANILFTKELAERLKNTGVTVNAVHNGVTYTKIMQPESAGFFHSLSIFIANIFIGPMAWIFCKTPEGAAQTTLYAALDPDLENVTGKYFAECKEEEIAPQGKDNHMAKWLWAVSDKWTRLREIPKDEKGNLILVSEFIK